MGAPVDGSKNQQWCQVGDGLQHVRTGLFLDTDVQYCHYRRGEPWESCGTELCVRPGDNSDRQRWKIHETVIQHRIDGRVLDVNFNDVKAGQGVNVNVHHAKTSSQDWLIEGNVIDVPDAETPLPPPIVAVGEDAEFLIQPSSAPNLCLAVRDDGYTKDPYEVYLAKVAQDPAAQKWRLVRNDTFQHVASGRFLHSETKYAFLESVDNPWEGNHTDLVTRPQDFSDAQRWVYGAPEFHGGKVLRHFKDGRGVDVHGWNMSDGNNVGCENSVHSDCRGVSYVFRII